MALRGQSAKNPLWSFTHPTFCRFFQKSTTDLSLPPIAPYQWRHSDPSIDIEDGSRSMEQVKQRQTIREALPLWTKLGIPARKSPTASPALRRTARGCVARRPAHGSSGTCWPLLKGHNVALMGSGARQVFNELRKHGVMARRWTGDELTEPSAFQSIARECKNGRLRAAFVAPSMVFKALERLRLLRGPLLVEWPVFFLSTRYCEDETS